MRRLALFAAVAGIVGAVSPGYSVEVRIPEGEYKLTWSLPQGIDDILDPDGRAFGEECSFPDMSGQTLSLIGPSTKWKFEGLVSKKAMLAYSTYSASGILGVVDESKGTGTGYDTAYLIPAAVIEGKNIDLSKLRKIRIGPSPYAQEKGPEWKTNLVMLDEPDKVLLDVPIGGRDSGIVKQVGVNSVRVQLASTEHPIGFMHATFRGRWKTSIEGADGASFTIATVDRNWNGVFGDRNASSGPGGDGDSLYVWANLPDGSGYGTEIGIGHPEVFQDGLHVISANKLGDSVTIKHYDGAMGKAQIKVVTGLGKEVPCMSADFNGPRGLFYARGSEALSLPAGSYSCSVHLDPHASDFGEDSPGGYWLSLDLSEQVAVKKGETTVVKVGGAVSAILAGEEKQVTAVQGVKTAIPLKCRAALCNATIYWVSEPFAVTAKITDSKGKVVWTGKPTVSEEKPRPELILPSTLKLGTYTITTTVTNPAYQKPTSVKIPLVVVKPTAGKPIDGLKAGTYKLEWKKSDAEFLEVSLGMVMEPMSEADVARTSGAKLIDPYWGKDGRYAVIVSKSADDVEMHDVGYLLWDAPSKVKIELGKAAKLELVTGGEHGQEGDMHPFLAGAENAVLPIAVGPAGSSVQRNMEMRLHVEMWPDEKGVEKPGSAYMEPISGPVARIPAGSGSVSVRLVDGDANGLYGDAFTPRKGEYESDCIIWDEPSGRFFGNIQRTSLGRTVLYQNKHYVFSIDPTGTSLTVKPYSGPMGKIKTEFTNAKGAPIKHAEVNLYGEDAAYELSSDVSTLAVPVGSYAYRVQWLGEGSASTWNRDEVWIHIYPGTGKKLDVTKDGMTHLKIGGPIKIELEPGSEAIKAKPGEEKKIDLSTKMGEHDCSATGSPEFEITDASGKVVAADELWVDWEEPKEGEQIEQLKWNYVFDVPVDIAPGDYTITVSVNTGSYQGVLSVKKPLKIVK